MLWPVGGGIPIPIPILPGSSTGCPAQRWGCDLLPVKLDKLHSSCWAQDLDGPSLGDSSQKSGVCLGGYRPVQASHLLKQSCHFLRDLRVQSKDLGIWASQRACDNSLPGISLPCTEESQNRAGYQETSSSLSYRGVHPSAQQRRPAGARMMLLLGVLPPHLHISSVIFKQEPAQGWPAASACWE